MSILTKIEFNLIDRGYESTLVLIPGWASDWRIFSSLNLAYNYILPLKFNPVNFNLSLSVFLHQKQLRKVSLLGWSLGGFVAHDFAIKYPQVIKEIFLISIRQKYDKAMLVELEQKLKNNKEAYLYKLYQSWFSLADEESLRWFRKNLLKKYLQELSLDYLLAGLNYLKNASLDVKSSEFTSNLTIFHGTEDKIAPLPEAESIFKKYPSVKFVSLTQLGHLPFLNKVFQEKFDVK